MSSLTPRQIKNIVSARSEYELMTGSQWFFIVKNTLNNRYHALDKGSYLENKYNDMRLDFESLASFSSDNYDLLHEVCLNIKTFASIAYENWTDDSLKDLSDCIKKLNSLSEDGVVFGLYWSEILPAMEQLVIVVTNFDKHNTAQQLDMALFQLFTLLKQDVFSKYPLIGRYKRNAFDYLNIEKRKAEFFSQAVLFEKDERFTDLLNQTVELAKRIEKLEATNAGLASNILDLTKLLQPVQNTKILVGNLATQAKSALKLNKKKDAGMKNE